VTIAGLLLLAVFLGIIAIDVFLMHDRTPRWWWMVLGIDVVLMLATAICILMIERPHVP